MTTEDRRYKICMRAAKVLVAEGDLKLAAELISRASLNFANMGAGLSGKDLDVKIAKHVHGVLITMKVSHELAWGASGLDALVG